ncbi:ribonuclease P protein component [Thiolinea disciformis]|uniref:ribonuclease P protein component n=1 Tax=Thiolinea disciformis TaxID=125614 RepID=UPI0003684C99|nr:ribonuclease P protein component [Thiolinea disciformis]
MRAVAFSYPRSYRITRASEFQRVFERGLHRRISVIGLLVRVRESTSGRARLGFALSKRSLKRAVDRNRVKRLTRESFRLHYSQLPAVDFVILSQAEVAGLDNTAILLQLDLLWQQAIRLYPKLSPAAVPSQAD